MRLDPVALEPITVEAGTYRLGNLPDVALSELGLVRTPGSAADPFRAIQTFPGLQSVGEGAGLFVRGGDVSGTGILLDGATVISPFRLDNDRTVSFGRFDPFMLKGVHFSAGGFGAEYGDALSGVADLRTVGKPAANEPDLTAALGGVSGRVHLDLSESFGGRATATYTNTDVLPRLNGRREEFDEAPLSTDLSGGFEWACGEGAGLKSFAMFHTDRAGVRIDDPGYSGVYRSDARADLVSVSGRHIFGSLGVSRTAATSGSRKDENFGVFQAEREDRLHWRRLRAHPPGNSVPPQPLLRCDDDTSVLNTKYKESHMSCPQEPWTPSRSPLRPARPAPRRSRCSGASIQVPVLASLSVMLAPTPGVSAQDHARAIADRVRNEVHGAFIAGNDSALADIVLIARRAVTALPDDALVNHYLGYALYRLGMQALEDDNDLAIEALEESEAYLQRSMKIHPIAESHALLAAVLGMRIVDDETAMTLGMRSEAEMSKARKLGPANPRVRLLVGISAFHAPEMWGGGHDTALAHFLAAVELFAEDESAPPLPGWGLAETYAWLGRTHAALGNVEEARGAYERALELEPGYAWVRDVLLPGLEGDSGRLVFASPSLPPQRQGQTRRPTLARNTQRIRHEAGHLAPGILHGPQRTGVPRQRQAPARPQRQHIDAEPS